jgi:hypothetical protein
MPVCGWVQWFVASAHPKVDLCCLIAMISKLCSILGFWHDAPGYFSTSSVQLENHVTYSCCLSSLAGLCSLAVYGARQLTCTDILRLTCLTALTSLKAVGCNTTFNAGPLCHGDSSRQDIDLHAGDDEEGQVGCQIFV